LEYIEFISQVHSSTKRNYLERIVEHDKATCAEVAGKFGAEYWDGDRQFGYGGYKYDGRWRAVAEKMITYYGIKGGDKILDVGCGKGFLLYELTQLVPEAQVQGVDVSEYGLKNAKEEVKPYLQIGNAIELPFKDNEFDFVVSLNVLHNLYNYQLVQAIREIERVGKKNKYIVAEAYRNEKEKVNLLCWQLTCRVFHTPKEWEWVLTENGYTGDFGCIYFE